MKNDDLNKSKKSDKIFLGVSSELCSLRKHPFLLALRRWGRFARRNARNVPSGEERGETDVFAGYELCSWSEPEIVATMAANVYSVIQYAITLRVCTSFACENMYSSGYCSPPNKTT